MDIHNFFKTNDMPEALILILQLAVTLILGIIIIKIIVVIARKTLDKSSADPVLYAFIIKALKVILWIMLGTICLSSIGVHISSIVAVLGAAGAAIALALKDSLGNIAGGIMIIVTKPFNQNDFITVDNVEGEVQKIDLFLTTLKTFDNKVVTIPNGIINTSVLINHSRQESRRVDLKFGISYKDDISQAKKIIADIIAKDDRIYKDENKTRIAVAEHGDSAILLDVLIWCDTAEYWNVGYDMREKVKIAFDEAGIEIPHNRLDVCIRQD